MNVLFKSWNCTAIGTYYGNHRKAIKLVDAKTDEMIAVATVNLPDHSIPEDCVFIKNYSENETMVKSMMEAGIIKPFNLGFVQSGYVKIPLYMLTEKALYELWDQVAEESNVHPVFKDLLDNFSGKHSN